jgi:hypothetical protein
MYGQLFANLHGDFDLAFGVFLLGQLFIFLKKFFDLSERAGDFEAGFVADLAAVLVFGMMPPIVIN